MTRKSVQATDNNEIKIYVFTNNSKLAFDLRFIPIVVTSTPATATQSCTNDLLFLTAWTAQYEGPHERHIITYNIKNGSKITLSQGVVG